MHVEQEFKASDKPALQVVMEADPEINFLKVEEERLLKLLEGRRRVRPRRWRAQRRGEARRDIAPCRTHDIELR